MAVTKPAGRHSGAQNPDKEQTFAISQKEKLKIRRTVLLFLISSSVLALEALVQVVAKFVKLKKLPYNSTLIIMQSKKVVNIPHTIPLASQTII